MILKPYFASLDEDGWTLDDGEQAHAQYPDTFWIPNSHDRHTLKPGDLAKLRFILGLADDEGNEEEATERMWVAVEHCLGGCYRGRLTNQPASTDEVLVGMAVWFEARHVLDILRQEERNGREE